MFLVFQWTVWNVWMFEGGWRCFSGMIVWVVFIVSMVLAKGLQKNVYVALISTLSPQ